MDDRTGGVDPVWWLSLLKLCRRLDDMAWQVAAVLVPMEKGGIWRQREAD